MLLFFSLLPFLYWEGENHHIYYSDVEINSEISHKTRQTFNRMSEIFPINFMRIVFSKCLLELKRKLLSKFSPIWCDIWPNSNTLRCNEPTLSPFRYFQ